MKVYDAPNIRNLAIVGHGGCGKTTLVLRAPVRRLGREPARPRRRRHHRHRLRPGRDRAKDQPAGRTRLRRVEEGQDQPDRLARLRELPLGGALGPARGRVRAGGGRRGRRHRGADREGLGLRERGRPRAARRGEPHGPRQRLVRAHARGHPEGVRARGGAARGADRRGQGVQGRRRPGVGQGPRLRGRRERKARVGRGSGRAGGDGQGLAREARRDGRREQRGADGGVLREGQPLGGAAGEGAAQRHRARAGSTPCCRLRRCATSA